MLQKIQLQTPEGLGEYFFVPDSMAYEQAKEEGVIKEGMDIVYRQFLVHVLPDMSMLILTKIMPMQAPIGGFDPGMQNFQFVVNGVPVDAAMGGMPQ